MKNLVEALKMAKEYENSLDWGWINDGGHGCSKLINEKYVELVKQPHDDWYGIQNFIKLTKKGEKAYKKISSAKDNSFKQSVRQEVDNAIEESISRAVSSIEEELSQKGLE